MPRKKNTIFEWWFCSKLPAEHIYIKPQDLPHGWLKITYLYIRRWFIHPIKRRFAKYYLEFLREVSGIKVVGITGSAGKTTTKEMLSSILKLQGKTVSSFANIDPIYNIPTTILRCSLKTKYLVLEMGVEYPGEMDFYLWLANPDVGVVTNIGPSHTLYFGDTGGVFREKSKLVKSLGKKGVAVLNNQDKLLRKLKNHLRSKVIWFGNGGEVLSSFEKVNADFSTSFRLVFNDKKPLFDEIKIPVSGTQFVTNALAAASAAKSLGFSLNEIKQGIATYQQMDHRMRILKHSSGAIIIDDSYNNNPLAAKLAIDTLCKVAKEKVKVVVFGDMLELGVWEEKYHKQIGEYIAKSHINKLVCVGRASFKVGEEAKKVVGSANVSEAESIKEAAAILEPLLKKGVYVLVKGSRAVGLDKLIDQLF